MSGSLAVVNCRQLVTLRGPARPRVRSEIGEPGIIQDGALLVRDGRISAAGSYAELKDRISAGTEVVDAGGGVVLPGFVDAHTHLVFAGNRADEFELRIAGATYEQIAAAGGGIRATVRRTRETSEDDLLEAARRHARWFLAHGTTTVEAKSGYGLDVETECKMLRVMRRLGSEGPLEIVPTFLGAHEVPEGCEREPYVDAVIGSMLPRVAAERLAEYCDVFCEPHIFPAPAARRILQAARGLGLGLRMHADQFTLSGGAKLAGELRTATADHLEHTDAESMDAMAAGGVQPVLLPGSVYALGLRGYADARAMIERGLAVVLATDFNPGSSPTASMPMVLSLACTQMRMTPAEALTAATVNAAYSLGRGPQIGSLEAGKRANFVVYGCGDYREIPYHFGVNLVTGVWVRGAPAQL
ncbi:MAG TPA: imidazolonepropionase [Bryobacteraceae bacterium]|nr:imidazolonepropionase [Bryobacteraceae bacterium]